jgi:hypothetical protein
MQLDDLFEIMLGIQWQVSSKNKRPERQETVLHEESWFVKKGASEKSERIRRLRNFRTLGEPSSKQHRTNGSEPKERLRISNPLFYSRCQLFPVTWMPSNWPNDEICSIFYTPSESESTGSKTSKGGLALLDLPGPAVIGTGKGTRIRSRKSSKYRRFE